MKKGIIAITVIILACILLTGIFSAGLVVGGLVIANRNTSELSQITPSIDSLLQLNSEVENISPDQPVATPTEEVTSFLSEINPFKSVWK